MINLAIYASGTGSNARKIVEYFLDHENIEVKLLISNKRSAKVLELAEEYALATCVVDREYFYNSNDLLRIHRSENIDVIVLAGFLWLIPPYLIEAFPNRIINIHPSLLPKFGGKGMYGMNIHRAVKEANEKESGLTIHIVNSEYDKGEVLYQSKYQIKPEDTPETIAENILALEHLHYPQVIESFIQNEFLN